MENIDLNEFEAFKLFNINNKKNLINIQKSKKIKAGYGLFASTDIEPNTPLVIYFGELITKDELYIKYLENKDKYLKDIAPYLRDSLIENHVIDASIIVNNKDIDIYLKGYLVNDYDKLTNLEEDNIVNYLNSEKECNVIIKDTYDFPVYYSKKFIKKGEELYAHYGLGYWLIQNKVEPTNIYDIYKKYNIQ